MKIIADTSHAKIWMDDHAPIIFTRLLVAPESSLQLQDFCDMHVRIIKDAAAANQGAVYSVCDAFALQPLTFDLIANYFMGVIQKQVRAGLTYKAFVKPRALKNLADLQEMIRKMDSMPVGIFETFEQANQSVLADWIRVKSGKTSTSAVPII